MKKSFIKSFVFLLLSLAFFTVPAKAQYGANGVQIKWVPALPATCSATSKQTALVYKYTATAGVYRCSATNTWTAIGSGGGSMAIGGAITGATANSVLFAGSGGVLAQNNSTFNFNDATGTLKAPVGLFGNGAALAVGGLTNSIESVVASGAGGATFGTADAAQVGYFNLRSGNVFWHFNTRGTGQQNRLALYFYSGSGYSAEFMTVLQTGQVGINNVSPTGMFDITLASASVVGQILKQAASPTSDAFQIRNSSNTVLTAFDSAANLRVTFATPASSTETCTTGTVKFDASFIYVCTATNTYKRSALSTF